VLVGGGGGTHNRVVLPLLCAYIVYSALLSGYIYSIYKIHWSFDVEVSAHMICIDIFYGDVATLNSILSIIPC